LIVKSDLNYQILKMIHTQCDGVEQWGWVHGYHFLYEIWLGLWPTI